MEHYYQAQKFAQHDPGYAEQVRLAATPGAAKRMGRSRQHRMREDWPEARETVMLAGLRAKFTQHESSRAVLLSTGDEELVEHAPWGDAYWGDGGNGTGRNRLGVLLVQVREELHA